MKLTKLIELFKCNFSAKNVLNVIYALRREEEKILKAI